MKRPRMAHLKKYNISIQPPQQENLDTYVMTSVTRLGDILDFGQHYKAFGNNKFAQISPHS